MVIGMKYKNALDDILGQKSKLKILRYLVSSNQEASGRQIAAYVGMSPTVCHQALADLVDHGVVKFRNIGRTYLYSLNPDSYVVEQILTPLYEKEKTSLDALVKDVIKTVSDRAVSIILFGSIARGEEEPSSDIDILVIARTSQDKAKIEDVLNEQALELISKYGNVLSPYVLTKRDFISKHKKNDRLIRNITGKGRVVYGKTVLEVLLS
jgi:predicted nucleotidyltransferase